MVLLRIRIDATPTSTHESVLKWATELSTRYAVFHHLVNDNSHYHLFLDSPMIMSTPAMRYKLKQYFKLESVQYSVKECATDRINEYVQYCYNTKHGNISTLLGTNLPTSDLTDAQTRAQDISDAYAKAHKSRSKPVSMYDIAKELVETCVDNTNDMELVKLAIKLLHKYLKCHDKFLVIKLVTTAQSMVDPSNLERICHNYFLN